MCSRQAQHRLRLGVELSNETPASMTLRSVRVVLPLGGLRERQVQVGVCGQLGRLPAVAGYRVAAGATVWIVTTLDVLRRCPAPDPVQFQVQFSSRSQTMLILVPGFNDLGGVPYPGCATTSS